jgi:nitrogen fixation protein NifB
VTSGILTPIQALGYLEKIIEKEPRIAVAGIAGPGDPMANPMETLETLRLIRRKYPEMLLCLASNGLDLSSYIDDLDEIGVSHVTVTVNAVDPEIGQRITSWVRDGKVIYRGRRGAQILLKRQIVVKVNTIIVPGINDSHVGEVAGKMAELGVDVLNCMPMYPNAGTPFEDVPEPGEPQMAAIRAEAEAHLPQMRHCTRCRADAVGLLGQDRSDEFRSCLTSCAASLAESENRPYVAVASLEGALVNLHLGEAPRFQIWSRSEGGYRLMEVRTAPEPGNGLKRWMDLARLLKDCRAILVGGIGENPRKVLMEAGIIPVEMNGFIEMGLDAVYKGGNMNGFKARRQGCGKGQSCKNDGGGCL